jgi:deoxyribonuclease-4
MLAARQLGAAGVVFHTGSHKGLGFEAVFDQVIGALQEVLQRGPEDTWLIIENCAGMGNEIGATFEELGRMASTLNDPRVRVCLDTQHACATSLDLATPAGLEQMMSDLEKHVGLERLALVHANDSKVPCGAALDRHENLGEGYIGIDAFKWMLVRPGLQDVPFILEVPGMDGHGPDKVNLDLLKRLRLQAAPCV